MEIKAGSTRTVDSVRSEFVQILVVAILLAVGTSVIAAGVVQAIPQSPVRIAFVGVAIISLVVLIVLWRVSRLFNADVVFEGLLPLTAERKIFPILRYKLSEDMARYFSAVSAENKALGKTLTKERYFESIQDGGIWREPKMTASGKLAGEAIEYYVLERLSLHLSGYFGGADFRPNRLIKLGRGDLHVISAENRFIELFSRPMQDREAFADDHPAPNGAKVVYAISANGPIFRHFELTLPKGAKVKRIDHGSILVKTKRFSIQIESNVQFFNVNVPPKFCNFYMKTNWREMSFEMCTIGISVKFAPWCLLTVSGWQYYRWLDSFLEKLRGEVVFEKFLSDIGWEAALTTLIMSQSNDAKSAAGIRKPRGGTFMIAAMPEDGSTSGHDPK